MHKRYQAFHNAEPELQKRILALESRWLQIQAQVEHLKQMWNNLPARLQVHFNHVLSLLQTLLIRGGNMVDALIVSKDPGPKDNVLNVLKAIGKEGKLRRGAFALTQKDALDNLIEELRMWHNDMLGPSWFQLLRLPVDLVSITTSNYDTAPQISQLQQLRRQIAQVEQQPLTDQPIDWKTNETVLIGQLPLFGSPLFSCMVKDPLEQVIIDTISLRSGIDVAGSYEAFRQLTEKIKRPEMPAINLLQCRGIVHSSDFQSSNTFAMLFKIPSGLSCPRSLRELLMECDSSFPLRHRFMIARQLAKSVMSIHSLKLVHKNVRPETIIVLSKDTDDEVESFVLGFEQFRPLDQRSLYRGDSDWRKNLYRHLSRQGVHPEAEYIMQHDIYSLGVCLLELGLKRSFVLRPGTTGMPHPDIELSQFPGKEQERTALMLKNRLQRIAKTELAAAVGQRYSNVVVSCLSCLDRGNSEFGEKEDFEDADDILVSVRFMEAVSTPSL